MATELVPVGLILASVAGTLGLILAMYARSGPTARRAPRPIAVTRVETPPNPIPAADPPAPAPQPSEPRPAPPTPVAAKPPAAPVEDPTKRELTRLGRILASEKAAAIEADRKAAALEVARRSAVAESERWRLRESIIHAQIDRLNATADSIERTQDSLAHERDVLVKQVDEAKLALARSLKSDGGYAVLPHKAQNGTWQRPVVIECRNGQAILRPKNQTFTMLDMSPLMGPRANPLVGAVARELIKVQDLTSPDGAPIVPYIYFIVRPDGIRPYYEARARLEPLGIAFGYELVEQDWAIEFPDLDTWENAASPLLARNDGASPGSGRRAGSSPGGTDPSGGTPGFTWPSERVAEGKGTGAGSGTEPFMWPRTPTVTPDPVSGAASRPGGDDLAGSLEAGGATRPRTSVPSWKEGIGGIVPRERPGGTSSKPGAGLGPAIGASEPGARGGAGPSPSESPGSRGGLIGGTPGNLLGDVRPTPGGPDPEPRGLSPVGPSALPGLDPAEEGDRRGGTARAGADPGPVTVPGTLGGLAQRPGASLPGALPRNLSPEALQALKELADSAAAGGGSRPDLPTRGDGRVRLDPSWLAQLNAMEDEDDERPALPPTGLRPGRSASGGMPSGVPGSGGSASATPGSGVPVGVPGIAMGEPGGSEANARTPAGSQRPGGGTAPGSQANRGPITVPLNLVIACGPDRVVIHPGGYRISTTTLRQDRGLVRHLETIVLNHAAIDPSVRPAPRLEFLVEPGGAATYEEARRQTVLSGVSWPVDIRVAESGSTGLLNRERY